MAWDVFNASMIERMRRLIVIFCCVAVTSCVMAQGQIDAKIDPVTMLIGEQAHLTVSVTAKKGTKIMFPEFKERQLLTPGIEIVGQEGDTADVDDDMVRVSKVLTLTSFDERLYAIPGMTVKVGGKSLTSNQLALKVMTVDVDTLHLNQFYPPKDVQDNPFMWSDWSGIFWLSCLTVLLCLLLFYLLVRLKQNKPIVMRIRIVKHIPAHQRALAEIEKMKNEKMATSEDQKAYYTKLTDTLRKYIEERFGFNAMEMTSGEIIYKLQSTGDRKMVDELKELFTTADLVKFAKYSTLMNENDLNLVNAINFIDQTKLDAQPSEERIAPQLSNEEKRSMIGRKYIKAAVGLIVVAVMLLIAYVVYRAYMLIN